MQPERGYVGFGFALSSHANTIQRESQRIAGGREAVIIYFGSERAFENREDGSFELWHDWI
jgi:hypothetical protein